MHRLVPTAIAAVLLSPAAADAAPKAGKPAKPAAPAWFAPYDYMSCFDAGRQAGDDLPGCTGSGAATIDGRLRAAGGWTSTDVAATTREGFGGSGLLRVVRVPRPAPALTFTATLELGAGAVRATSTGAGTGYVKAFLFARPSGCTACPSPRGQTLLAQAEGPAGDTTAPAGTATVSVTVTAPAGELLLAGDWVVNPVLQAGGLGPRVPLTSGAGRGAVTATGVTVTG